jgi:hypothetical protein
LFKIVVIIISYLEGGCVDVTVEIVDGVAVAIGIGSKSGISLTEGTN